MRQDKARAAAEGDDPAAPIADREYHAIAKAVIRHRNVVARNQQARFDHVLDRNPLRAEILLERKAFAGRVAEAKLHLDRRRNRAIGEIAARLGAAPRRQRIGEEFR